LLVCGILVSVNNQLMECIRDGKEPDLQLTNDAGAAVHNFQKLAWQIKRAKQGGKPDGRKH